MYQTTEPVSSQDGMDDETTRATITQSLRQHEDEQQGADEAFRSGVRSRCLGRVRTGYSDWGARAAPVNSSCLVTTLAAASV